MTRNPEIADERLEALELRLAEMGYDPADLRRVPQSWPDAGHPVTAASGDLARWTRAH
ncbi:hypothetical protein Pla86_10640 [Planctomycetes bacterium Pla86]|uniref:Uncharacterized protein n=1 Tax=Engelhardtia mirabilis TaxID=2528011 RepID=A0A518BG96_9BACT|nr:hypothetical protein Pla133_10650 [Planctomycetes bacterium Pla133]QDV00325.1 hypothetical protein Pla86_10640 [Planctomycetes bacterium Pla86]